jgi:peptidoglycan/xylan/chitin deacetylase (PgdA/CDA1 family)
MDVRMRLTIAVMLVLAFLGGTGRAQAADCPGHPNAMGVSRTIVLNPAEHPLLGTLQYKESLPLNDHEVVLTFDDGPLPPYTTRVLDTLASECIKATFFLVGRMALGYPSLVQREYNAGHTIAGHSQNHPFTFAKMSVGAAAKEIEDGFASLRTVLGDPRAIAPFFRIPGLLRQDSVEQYLERHHYATWSLDFLADDWTHISANEITRRALQRIEARHRGILLLHDIQPATALALPTLLAELKARGYKIVHVVPSTPDRPATVAQSADWVQRHPLKSWPRVLPDPAPVQPGPGVPAREAFGLSNAAGEQGDTGRSADAQASNAAGSGGNRLQELPAPNLKLATPIEGDPPPAPDAKDFIYSSGKFGISHGAPNRKADREKLAATTVRPNKPVGHQLNVLKPAASLLNTLAAPFKPAPHQ